ncbi:transposase domain-containing protein [Streptomyces sp. NBC_00882]|uniref:transposase domain-containing protein n=1 Tax=Streptomyces TaxID=1883 RepID=UPI003870A016|nr:transposase domain-containing protein [Streptomyces sp. NBC_00882]WSZ63762.1 transposase domain-containing protein [Streptomyces canus]
MASGHIAGETYPERTRMGLLSRTFRPELVHLAIEETGVREERTKALPSHLVVYFTLTMWLFTHLGYGAVLRELVENFPLRKGELWRPARTGSITKARARIGQAPLRWLFNRVAGVRGTRATPGVFWRELRAMSMDGTCFDVSDSSANAAAYSRPSNGSRPAAYPQVRMVALGECGTRSLAGAVFDSLAVGERTLARRLLPYFAPRHAGDGRPRLPVVHSVA